MLTNTNAPPTDQRAGAKPISFVLQNGTTFGAPVTLKIRPTDLVKQDPSRTVVHQTLGRDASGWVDNYGPGIPSCTIAGNTGWRAGGASGMDGAAAFEQLNKMVMVDYHSIRQNRIQAGQDPAECKLIFVDTLDNFCWSVTPITFELRRNKANPLLYMYNIRLQAVSTDVDNPLVSIPNLGTVTGGLKALSDLIGKMESFGGNIVNWVSDALGRVDALLKPAATIINDFYKLSLRVFNSVNSTVSAVKGGIAKVSNSLIGMAGNLARVGTNIFRSISTITSLPGYLKSSIMRVAGSYNEAFCILRNSLRPRKLYEDYDDLYGASNCSSTTGGRPASMYANTNVFSMLQSDPSSISATNAAMNSISELNRGDPALTAINFGEMVSHVSNINSGVTVYAVDNSVFVP